MSTSGAPATPPAAGPPAAGPPATGPAVAGGRPRRGGTAVDMLRSMVVIVVLVAIVYVAVPRPQGRITQPVDVGTTVAEASAGGVALDAPQVPKGWTPNLSTFEPDPKEGLPTLSLGWVLPEGTFVGVRATRGPTPAWTSDVTAGGRADDDAEPVTLEGRAWQSLVSENDRRRSLVLGADGAGTTYVVTGTAPQADLERVAAQVVPG